MKIRILLAALCALAFTGVNAAAETMPKSCDPDFMTAINARAWLNAQRDVTQAENLIAKPDSILEYSCFDITMTQLAANAKNLFSGGNSPSFGNEVIPEQKYHDESPVKEDNALPKQRPRKDRTADKYTSLGGKLSRVNAKAGGAYLSSFSHSFRGGRSNQPKDENSFTIRKSATPCKMMNQVWNEAQCSNIHSRPSHDGFFTFQNYAGNDEQGEPRRDKDKSDKRVLPAQCKNAEPITWDDSIAASEVSFMDEYTSYVEELGPDKCSSIPPIETGLTVFISGQGGGSFPDAACLPGCYYTGTTCEES